MDKNIYYLKVNFRHYTEETEEILIKMCGKVGCVVNRLLEDRTYLIFTDDKEVVRYIRFLSDCDMISILN